MQIVVTGADWSQNNIGNIAALGIYNLNKNEGERYAYFMPQQTDNSPYGEASNKPGLFMASGIANPLSQNLVHAFRWTYAVHNSTTASADTLYIDGKSGNYALPLNPNYVHIGFWINRTLYDAVKTYDDRAVIGMAITAGASAVSSTSVNIMDVDGLNIPKTVELSISEGQSQYISAETITYKHTAQQVINGETWVYVDIEFRVTWASTEIRSNCSMRFTFVGRYCAVNESAELLIPISDVTVTTSDEQLSPYYLYPEA